MVNEKRISNRCTYKRDISLPQSLPPGFVGCAKPKEADELERGPRLCTGT